MKHLFCTELWKAPLRPSSLVALRSIGMLRYRNMSPFVASECYDTSKISLTKVTHIPKSPHHTYPGEKMKKSLIVLALIFSLASCFAQWQWAHSVGNTAMESAWDVTAVPNDGIYVCGSFTGALEIGTDILPAFGLDDIFVLKYSYTGTYLWGRSFGSPEEDVALSIDHDFVGNIYITGYTTGSMQVDANTLPHNGMWDAFVIKLDPEGSVIFAQSFGGALNDIGYGISVNAGKIYVTGWFADSIDFGDGIVIQSFGGSDIYIACFNEYGEALWARRAGTEGVEYGFDVASDNCGNCYVTGVSGNNTDHEGFLLTGDGAFVAKYDPNGVFLWATRLHYAGVNSIGYHQPAEADAPGFVYLTGRFTGMAIFGENTLYSVEGSDDIYTAVLRSTTGEFYDYSQAGGNASDRGRACSSKSSHPYPPVFTGSYSEGADLWGYDAPNSGNFDIYVHSPHLFPGVNGFATPLIAGGEESDIATSIAWGLHSGEPFIIVSGWHFGQTRFGDYLIDSGNQANGNLFIACFAAASTSIPEPENAMIIGSKLYPNPFSDRLSITLNIEKSQTLKASVYNLRGQMIKEIYHGNAKAGNMELSWNGKDSHGKSCAPGVYLMRVEGDFAQVNRKMLKR